MTPAVPVSFTSCAADPYRSTPCGLPHNDNIGVIILIDNHGVNRQAGQTVSGQEAMAVARQRPRVAPKVGKDAVSDGKANVIAELMLEVAQCFFRIRAVGQKTGLITSWGGGAFGFLRSLALLGPLTVPEIAEMRPTSRQRMQRLADELADQGLVELVDNPRHRRSKLVRLTRKGEARYQKLSGRFLAIASTMGTDLSEADIRKAIVIVRQISNEAKGRGARRPRRTAAVERDM
jgi:DNA-binding MarR family transcriptional regulator